MSAARAFARTKPIVAYKAGRFAESAQAAASHTGAMAGVDAVYEAAFQRAGIERIFEIDDMFDCRRTPGPAAAPQGRPPGHHHQRRRAGRDDHRRSIARGGELAQLSGETIDKLNQFLPACWSHGNPVDLLGDAPPERFAKALDITVLKDQNVDAVLVILTPQAMTDAAGHGPAVGQVAAHAHKPVLAAWMGGRSGRRRAFGCSPRPASPPTTRRKRPCRPSCTWSPTPATWASSTRRRATCPWRSRSTASGVRADFAPILAEGGDVLSENVSKAFLEAYEIPVTRPHAGPHRRRGRRGRPAAGLSGGGEDPLAADHPQDGSRRRDLEPRRRRGGAAGLRRDDGRRGPAAARRHAARRHRAEDGHLSQQLRADPGQPKGPGLRPGDHGGHGRRGGRGLPRSGPGPAAVERVAGPADAGIAQVVAAACRAIAAGRAATSIA